MTDASSEFREWLDVLDDEGRPVRRATRAECHRLGLPHRVVHVLVLHPDCDRLLLQRRSATKATHPGLWDTPVGGHVDAGEAPPDAARREMREEIGIDGGDDLLRLHEYRFEGDPLDRELVVTYGIAHPGPFSPDPAEVSEVAFFDRAAIEDLVAAGETTPHFNAQWGVFLDHGGFRTRTRLRSPRH